MQLTFTSSAEDSVTDKLAASEKIIIKLEKVTKTE